MVDIEAGIAWAKATRKTAVYKYGRHGPKAYDCVGFVLGFMRQLGIDASVYPLFWTTRAMTAWGEKTGALKLGVAGIERGMPFLWGDATRPDHRPVAGAGHTGICLQPPSAKHPRGRAISAYNPDKDIIIHDLIPAAGDHLAFFGYLVVNPPAVPVDPPATEQPEPPAPSDEVVEQPDDPPTADELQARIDAAVATLEGN